MRPTLLLTTLVAVISMLAAASAMAAVPQMINYQGRLTNPDGTSVDDGVYSLRFRIYDAPTEGSELWSSLGFVPLQVTGGLFSHSLGSTSPIPDSLTKYDFLWLGITVELDDELAPRTELTSVMFSYKALMSEIALSADLASHADSATHSIRSDSSMYSIYADSATHTIYSDTAVFADTSNYSTFADTANVTLSIEGCGSLAYPDGVDAITPVIEGPINSNNTYTVPAGKNLYITTLRLGTTQQASFTIDGYPLWTRNTTASISPTLPLIASAGQILATTTTTSEAVISGFLVNGIVTAITHGNTAYVVPTGKMLIVLNTECGGLIAGQQILYGSYLCGDIHQPIPISAGTTVQTEGIGGFNGYLKDE